MKSALLYNNIYLQKNLIYFTFICH